jgi:hypothetical protein
MVKVKLDRKTGKCEIIDDAEGTPGSSRQITRFRQYCLPVLEEEVKKDKTLKTTNANNIRFNEYGFDFSSESGGNEKYYILTWDLIENLDNE